MTTPTHGADVQALRQTAQRMCDAAEELIATDLRINGALSSLTWNGPDAMRALQAWDAEHGPALYRTARTLVVAGEQLLREADDQEQASASGGLPDRPAPGAVGVAVRSTLAAELFSMRRVLDALTPSAQTVDALRDGISTISFINTLNSAYERIPLPAGLSTGITVVGAANDAYSLGSAWREGDLAGVVSNGGSLGFTALATRLPVHGALAGASWHVGWEIGEAANTAMADTRFEQNFRNRMDSAFDALGAWGMLATPVGLAYAGAETLWETAAERISGDDAAGPGVGGP